ncbi:MAG TPA: glutamate racemase [Oceanithermus profundus]|uniref:Glutamate racemase n=1 Tax=Oceanithermus profundus TaxID=187137 RepID=A0A7C4ZCL1_9DEIN|nr:glutamate racemase [Oceanithermus profundus]
MSPDAHAPLEQPIGVFDSGVGGLTVLEALRRVLPGRDFLYFGDTARVPYGSKPPELVRRFAWEISGFLLRQGAAALVVACNTASSVALDDLRRLGVPVFDVIEPAVAEAARHTHVGVIGTRATVASGAYQARLEARGRRVWALATPLFVPIVEEGLWNDGVAELVARHYLEGAPDELEALILGCTHYPYLKPLLARLRPELRLIDSAEPTARAVAERLGPGPGTGRVVHYVTGDPEAYRALAERLGAGADEVRKVELGAL